MRVCAPPIAARQVVDGRAGSKEVCDHVAARSSDGVAVRRRPYWYWSASFSTSCRKRCPPKGCDAIRPSAGLHASLLPHARLVRRRRSSHLLDATVCRSSDSLGGGAVDVPTQMLRLAGGSGDGLSSSSSLTAGCRLRSEDARTGDDDKRLGDVDNRLGDDV